MKIVISAVQTAEVEDEKIKSQKRRLASLRSSIIQLKSHKPIDSKRLENLRRQLERERETLQKMRSIQ